MQSNTKSENGFHLREIRPQGGFQLRNPIPDFMDFFFIVRLGNPKKDLQNCSFCVLFSNQAFEQLRPVEHLLPVLYIYTPDALWPVSPQITST